GPRKLRSKWGMAPGRRAVRRGTACLGPLPGPRQAAYSYSSRQPKESAMSCSEDAPPANDALDALDDAAAAAAFRRLVRLLRHRSDAANIDLMGLAGFCRNCLGDWIAEAGN